MSKYATGRLWDDINTVQQGIADGSAMMINSKLLSTIQYGGFPVGNAFKQEIKEERQNKLLLLLKK